MSFWSKLLTVGGKALGAAKTGAKASAKSIGNSVIHPSQTLNHVEKPRDFDPFGQTGFGPFGYNMIAPLKSWCWGSILFYTFKISRFS